MDETAMPRPSAVLGLTLGVAAIGMEALVVSPLLADVARDLDTTPSAIGQAVSTYGLALALTAPLFGIYGARFSRLTLMRTGLALFILATLGCAAASGPWTLAAARAACGMAAGAYLPACYAFVADTTSYDGRAKVMGRVMFGWSLALVAGVPLGGLVGQFASWRASFLVVAVLGLVALVISAGWQATGSRPAPVPSRRDRLPASTVRIFALTFFNMVAFYGVYTYVGTALRAAQHAGSGSAGLSVLAYGLGLAVSTLRGDVLDRLGKVRSLCAALLALAPTLSLLPAAIATPAWLLPLMVLWGLLQGAVLTGLTTVLTQAAGPSRGLATAFNSSVTYLALALGAELGGRAMDSNQGFAVICFCAGAANLAAWITTLGL